MRANGDKEHLLELCLDYALEWKISPLLRGETAQSLISLDHREEAIKLLGELTQEFPRSIRPKQLRALTLAQSGLASMRLLAMCFT